MAYIGPLAPEIPEAGFSFENYLRNTAFAKAGYTTPSPTSTGTTIVGLIYKDGVILGADTRATVDRIVSDKNCSKIHYLAENMYCCGAGTAADTEVTTQIISSQLELHRLNSGRIVPVVAANTMLKQLLFRYHGGISASLVLGGVDMKGPHLYCIHPLGSTDKIPYASMGSGSLAAMGVFESKWKANMSERRAKDLVCCAVNAGILNDPGSGSFVDLCVIRSNGDVTHIRPYEKVHMKGERQACYSYSKGTTAVLSTIVTPIDSDDLPIWDEAMDVVQ